MSAALLISRLCLRNRELLVTCAAFLAVLLVVLLRFTTAGSAGGIPVALMVLLVLASGAALLLGTGQRELQGLPLSYHLPGLRRHLLIQHAVVAGVLAAVGVVLALTQPAIAALASGTAVTASGPGILAMTVAMTVAAITAAIYGAVLLLTLLLPGSPWAVVAGPMAVIFAAAVAGNLVTGAEVAGVLARPWPATVALVAVAALAVPVILSRGRHRRLVGTPYLSIGDIRDRERLARYCRRRDQRVEQASGRDGDRAGAPARVGGGLFQALTGQAARTMTWGRRARALASEAAATWLMAGVPRSRAGVLASGLSLAALVVVLGYVDARQHLLPDDDAMVGWFPGLPFLAATYVAGVFQYLRTRPLGGLAARRDLHRAGWWSAAWTVGLGIAVSAGLWGLSLVGTWLLPPITVGGCVLDFQLPPGHLLALPVFAAPAQLLLVTLMGRTNRTSTLRPVVILPFFLFHALLLWPETRVAAAILAAACWLAWATAWRWRALRGDLA